MKIEITSLDEKGRGLGEGYAVPYAYPGDVVEIEIVNHKKKLGKLLKLVSPSAKRQTPACKHFGLCGGCIWQGLKYEEQLKFKEGVVKKLFGDSSPILPSPREYFYRNRMDFAFGPDFTLGLKNQWDRIIDVEKCWLMSEGSNKIVRRLKYFTQWKKLRKFKEAKDGILRHAVIREGKFINNNLVNILTAKGEFNLEELWEKLSDLTRGLLWSINPSPADRSVGDIQKFIGQDYLEEKLGPIRFRIPAQSFFQTNSYQAVNLLETIKKFAALSGSEKVLELYSGVGTIGLSLAHQAEEIIGVEENEEAVKDAENNAMLNEITNYSALAGRAEDMLEEFEYSFDIAIVDPPRPGIHKKVIAKLGEARPDRIIYVSCNPHSQKQDIDKLLPFGYKITAIQPLDLFPHTPHIENVILLRH
jgi:23S rRNA (uracil-5-)-methyltransferase RumA